MTTSGAKFPLGQGGDIAIDVAFQPIFDLDCNRVFAYEALVREPGGTSAANVLTRIPAEEQHRFDLLVRTVTIEKAIELGLLTTGAALAINSAPSADPDIPRGLEALAASAQSAGLSHQRIIMEYTEDVQIDVARARRIAAAYRQAGFRCALDDFGAGYHCLLALAEIETDIVKIDMGLIRGIDRCPVRRSIVAASVRLLRELNREIVAEGIETAGELAVVCELGIGLVQGFYLGRPSLTELQREPYGVAQAA